MYGSDIEQEGRLRHARTGFCPITGVPLSLCDEIVETAQGKFVEAKFVDPRLIAADRQRLAELEADIERIDDEITTLECQRENVEVASEDVKYRLGLRPSMPQGYRDRRAKELAEQRQARKRR